MPPGTTQTLLAGGVLRFGQENAADADARTKLFAGSPWKLGGLADSLNSHKRLAASNRLSSSKESISPGHGLFKSFSVRSAPVEGLAVDAVSEGGRKGRRAAGQDLKGFGVSGIVGGSCHREAVVETPFSKSSQAWSPIARRELPGCWIGSSVQFRHCRLSAGQAAGSLKSGVLPKVAFSDTEHAARGSAFSKNLWFRFGHWVGFGG